MTFTLPNLTPPVVGNPLSQSYLYNQMYNPLGFLLNPPQASIYSAANQPGAANATNYQIPFDSTDYDNYGGHSTTVNNTRYTCQVPGLYQIHAHVTFAANATGMRMVEIWVNGGVILGSRNAMAVTGASTTGLGMEANTYHRLNVGDYVEVNTQQWSGGTLAINGSSSTGQTPMLQLLWVGM